ncbi:MAG: DUF6291 domain-containing protein [Elusimicrobiota bacterium]|jgi:hypothetical protein|nr:DUF6291 domain-containing protein [Elusimicrobiota bacterium]
MINKKTFILCHNYREIFENLSDEYAGILIKKIFEYEIEFLFNNKNEFSIDERLKFAFILIRQFLDLNIEKYIKKN